MNHWQVAIDTGGAWLVRGQVDHPLGEGRAAKLRRKYGNAFPAGYRDMVPARAAVADIEMIEGLGPARPFGRGISCTGIQPRRAQKRVAAERRASTAEWGSDRPPPDTN